MSSIKTVDKWFSEYIRKRDTQSGAVRCPTCGGVITYETSDAGHFISRRFMNTRWNEKNVHAQCRKCNRFQYGNQYEFGLFIDSKYGKGEAEKLLFLSKLEYKPMPHELKEIAKYFRQKIKEL